MVFLRPSATVQGPRYTSSALALQWRHCMIQIVQMSAVGLLVVLARSPMYSQTLRTLVLRSAAGSVSEHMMAAVEDEKPPEGRRKGQCLTEEGLPLSESAAELAAANMVEPLPRSVSARSCARCGLRR